MDLLEQFKRFLENEITNPEIEAEDRVLFNSRIESLIDLLELKKSEYSNLLIRKNRLEIC